LFANASHNSRLQPVTPVPGSTEIITRVNELIAGLRSDNVDLLEAFHRIQHEYGYVPREAVPLLAGRFNTTPAIIFGTIDFYSEIRTDPPAEDVVEWCSGPACLLKNSMGIRRALEAVLGCATGRTTPDRRFELRLVQCDGTCHMAPLIRHRGRYIGPLTASSAINWARNLKGEEPAPAAESTEDEAPASAGEAAVEAEPA
jgi:NADH:ubiquinone oxidoreductase subunit E